MFKCPICEKEHEKTDYGCLDCGEIFWQSEEKFIASYKRLFPNAKLDDIKKIIKQFN